MWYILNKYNTPIEVDINEYYEWVTKNPEKNIIAKNYFGKHDEIFVSTVFLGLDCKLYNDSKKPIFWETIVFWPSNDKFNNMMKRYSSHKEAVKGHQKMVKFVIKEISKTLLN